MTKKEKAHIVLETKDLDIGYRHKNDITLVASEINISLSEGELVGLVGANGIGKSTLLRTLTKVQPPLKGQIILNGTSLTDFGAMELARALSIVLTEPIVSKNLTIYELVSLGRQPYTNWIGRLSENDHHKIDLAISLTNIEAFKHKKCYELSDGQLQKAMIARALAQDTELIILDEPTTHLDMYHKAYVLLLMKKLARETKKTVLFSSHEIDLSIQLCDKIIVMSENKVQIASPEEHIEQGNFNALFPVDMVEFDSETRAFRIKK